MGSNAPYLVGGLPLFAAKAVAGNKPATQASDSSTPDIGQIIQQQTDAQNKLYGQMKQAQDDATSQARTTEVRDQAEKDEAASIAQSKGRQSTILTSPLGILPPPGGSLGVGTGQKTLLGE